MLKPISLLFENTKWQNASWRLTTMTKEEEMGHSAHFYFTLLHLANLRVSFQCINVNSSKFNNISVINVSLIRMYQYVSNNSVSNKECSNIDLKLRKKKNSKIRESAMHWFFCVILKSKLKHLPWNKLSYCVFAKALSLKCIPLRKLSC